MCLCTQERMIDYLTFISDNIHRIVESFIYVFSLKCHYYFLNNTYIVGK